MYATILVALDGSQREPDVLRTAVTLAAKFGARLHACRAVARPVGIPDTLLAMAAGGLDHALLADAEQAIAARVASTDVAVTDTHVRIGQPADVVLDVAEEIGAELLVIGAHGYGPIERVMGTTASKIVHRAHCSVLVSRSGQPPTA
ncbi:MAG: universal stress protein [Deltaproteobacteria bacterium]|nr:universal stress protein [Nannocystaceae bacterium]